MFAIFMQYVGWGIILYDWFGIQVGVSCDLHWDCLHCFELYCEPLGYWLVLVLLCNIYLRAFSWC